jgi:hypothetical protein
MRFALAATISSISSGVGRRGILVAATERELEAGRALGEAVRAQVALHLRDQRLGAVRRLQRVEVRVVKVALLDELAERRHLVEAPLMLAR